MENTLLLKTNCGKVFAVIENVQRTDSLLSIRERVVITQRQNFDYLLFGTALKPKQESKTLVKDCSVVKELNGDAHEEITIKLRNAQAQAENTAQQVNCGIFTDTLSNPTPKSSLTEQPPFVDKPASQQDFANFSASKKKIDVYTEEEISEAEGLLLKEN